METASPCRCTSTRISPPRGVNFTAFDKRLSSIWRHARLSAMISGMSSGRSAFSAMPACSARNAMTAQQFVHKGRERNRFECKPVMARLDGGEIEQRVDDAEHVLAGLMNDLGVALAAFEQTPGCRGPSTFPHSR